MDGVKWKNAAAIVFAGKESALFLICAAFFLRIELFWVCLGLFGGLGLEVPGRKPLVLGFAKTALAQVFFEVGHVGGAVEDGDVAFFWLAELLIQDAKGDLVALGDDDRTFAVEALVDAGEHEFDLVELAGEEPFEGVGAVAAGEDAEDFGKRGRARLAGELHAPFLEGGLEYECEEVFFLLILKAGEGGGVHVCVDEVGG